jgi:hypothetical protein
MIHNLFHRGLRLDDTGVRERVVRRDSSIRGRIDGENGTQIWQVTLTPGQYDSSGLAALLESALNALPGVTNTYTVTHSSTTKKITISATGGANYTFYFQTGTPIDEIDPKTGILQTINTPARLFGFESFNYSSGTTLVAPNRADPDLFLKRLYHYINVDSGIELNRMELGAGRRDCFHIFYMGSVKDGYYFMNTDVYLPIYYSSPAPIARLSALQISIRDEFYRLVDLGQHDFTLIFEITYLE